MSLLTADPGLRRTIFDGGQKIEQDWLIRYGYLQSPDTLIGGLQTKESIEEAVRKMQRFAGIEETGNLDQKTLEMMGRPRCSLPDTISFEELLKRNRRGKNKVMMKKKRYTLPKMRWDKTDITWSMQDFPPPSVSPALNPDEPSPQTDITVTFTSGYHEDGYPFDGKGGALAHAFFPGKGDLAGDTHFDAEESWTYGDWSSDSDLFTVAVHEFGHALGLFHSSSSDSIMKPYYFSPVGEMNSYSLTAVDRLGIQALYGKQHNLKPPPSVAAPTTYPTQFSTTYLLHPPYYPPDSADRCQGGYDAVANIRAEIFFFRGNQYWVFRNTMALPGYPRQLSDWGLHTAAGQLAESVEAVFVWPHNGKTYVFSSGLYWRFDEAGGERKMEEGYPKPAAIWGMPSHPDDIIAFLDGETYFFKDSNYWILQRGGLDLESASPKSIATDWMKCDRHVSAPTPEIPRDRNCSCVQNVAAVMRSLSVIIYLTNIICILVVTVF
ncbi:matrix metalloproteinase-25 isoform X7 [Danio rerio]|uniref:Matrix metalloproteinase-25 isoform X7 n=1 Tax=Danio rerio TaxID=7955 RepID=A0AC58J2H3_DANRE